MFMVAVLGLLAGMITTLAGMGGGLVLVLGLALMMDPAIALVITGPALLVGNLHRVWMYAASVDRSMAWRYALGGVPGALVGAMALGVVPIRAVEVAMLLVAVLASVKVLAGWTWSPPAGALVPGGFAVGFTTSTAGGGGLIGGPLLLASGLEGRAYVATAAVGASAVHVARMAGYGASGALDPTVLGLGLFLAGLVSAGNAMGERVRVQLDVRGVAWLERATVMGCVGLAAVGLVS